MNMDEETQKTPEGETEEKTEEKNEEAVFPLDEAKRVLEETKAQADKITAERKKIEKATAELLISGKGLAGQNKEVSEEEKKKQGAKEFFKGTLVEKALERHG